MSERDRYDRDHRPRRQDEDEGFFRRIRGWLSNDEERGDPRSEGSRDREWDNRERDARNRSRQWRGPERYSGDRDYANRGYQNRGPAGQEPRRPSERDLGRYSQNRSEERFGRSDQTGYDWTFDRDYNYENDYHRDRGGETYPLGQQEDWEDDSPTYYGLGRGDDRQHRRGGFPRGASIPTAGMRSDFESRYRENEGAQGLNYRQGDLGYDREGAFYQDLDEPANHEGWEVWRAQGEYSGFGPRGYRRPDERIWEDVCERLTRHGRVDARDVEVTVKDGVVTLTGSVPYREMKRMAEDSIEQISGVKDINNEIRVQHRPGQRSDRWERAGEGRGEETARKSPVTAAADHAPVSEGINKTLATETGGQAARGFLREGMEVLGSGGQVVGKVKEIRERDFLVDRDLARDIYIPYEAVQSVGAQALLAIPHDQVDDQNWEMSSIT